MTSPSDAGRSRPGPSGLARWLVWAGWATAILAAIPYANDLQRALSSLLGLRWAWGATSIVALLAVLAAVFGGRRRGWRPTPRAGAAVVIGAAVAVGLSGVLPGPGEPLHIVQYGILSLLTFWALRSHLDDRGLYFLAIVLCAAVGTIDELIQWWTPRRYWDLRDVALNAGSAALVQAVLAQTLEGLAPVRSATLRSVARWGLLQAALLGVGITLASIAGADRSTGRTVRKWDGDGPPPVERASAARLAARPISIRQGACRLASPLRDRSLDDDR